MLPKFSCAVQDLARHYAISGVESEASASVVSGASLSQSLQLNATAFYDSLWHSQEDPHERSVTFN